MAVRADVAELVDAHGSGPCGGNPVEVQVLSSAFDFDWRRYLALKRPDVGGRAQLRGCRVASNAPAAVGASRWGEGLTGIRIECFICVPVGVLRNATVKTLEGMSRALIAFSEGAKSSAAAQAKTTRPKEAWRQGCQACAGTGKKRTQSPCYLCGGSGVLGERDERGNMQYEPCRGPAHGTFVEVKCETCHGTGKV